MVTRCRTRNPWSSTGLIEISRRIRGDQLQTGNLALSHAALDDAGFQREAARSRREGTNPDEPFFRALRKARERFAGKSITTRDLMQVFEEEFPRPVWYDVRHKMDWFVDGWINGTAMPELSTREIHIAQQSGVTTVSGYIVQKDAPNDLVTAVPVYGETSSNSMVFLGEVLADGPETAFHLSTPANVHKVVIDPKQTILTAPK